MSTDPHLPQFLLRIWGGNQAKVQRKFPPHAVEAEGQETLCYWFHTRTDRAKFMLGVRSFCDTMLVLSETDPGPDEYGENIDTHLITVAMVTLRLPDGREGTFRDSCGYGYPEHSVRSMWEDGNYSCDCNRADFIRDCVVGDVGDFDCGDTIELVRLDVVKEPALDSVRQREY